MFLSPNIKKCQSKHKSDNQTTDSFEEKQYLPPHLLPKHKRSTLIQTFSKTPKSKSPRSKNLSKTQTSFSCIYKPQHIQGKTFKLPAVSDLLNLSLK